MNPVTTTPAQQPSVVITGGTRGIGFALAKAFLDAGWQVLITGRSQSSLDRACKELPVGKLYTEICELSSAQDIQTVWDTAAKHWGRVDVWINNAGMSVPSRPFWEHRTQDLEAIASTNYTGSLLVARIVGKAMVDQGRGHLYFMEGLGSLGEYQESLIAYGSSKYGVAYIARKLALASKATGLRVGALSPGMVITDLLLADAGGVENSAKLPDRLKKLYNILADKAETVGPWLADRVIKDWEHPAKPGQFRRHAWLTTAKAFRRFMSAPFSKRDLFA